MAGVLVAGGGAGLVVVVNAAWQQGGRRGFWTMDLYRRE
jgi:hypothetical protein